MNSKQAYARRAAAVFLLREKGFKICELAAIFKTTPEPIRALAARGARAHRGMPEAAALFCARCRSGPLFSWEVHDGRCKETYNPATNTRGEIGDPS